MKGSIELVVYWLYVLKSIELNDKLSSALTIIALIERLFTKGLFEKC